MDVSFWVCLESATGVAAEGERRDGDLGSGVLSCRGWCPGCIWFANNLPIDGWHLPLIILVGAH